MHRKKEFLGSLGIPMVSAQKTQHNAGNIVINHNIIEYQPIEASGKPQEFLKNQFLSDNYFSFIELAQMSGNGELKNILLFLPIGDLITIKKISKYLHYIISRDMFFIVQDHPSAFWNSLFRQVMLYVLPKIQNPDVHAVTGFFGVRPEFFNYFLDTGECLDYPVNHFFTLQTNVSSNERINLLINTFNLRLMGAELLDSLKVKRIQKTY